VRHLPCGTSVDGLARYAVEPTFGPQARSPLQRPAPRHALSRRPATSATPRLPVVLCRWSFLLIKTKSSAERSLYAYCRFNSPGYPGPGLVCSACWRGLPPPCPSWRSAIARQRSLAKTAYLSLADRRAAPASGLVSLSAWSPCIRSPACPPPPYRRQSRHPTPLAISRVGPTRSPPQRQPSAPRGKQNAPSTPYPLRSPKTPPITATPNSTRHVRENRPENATVPRANGPPRRDPDANSACSRHRPTRDRLPDIPILNT
jgi:hypothetical protein